VVTVAKADDPCCYIGDAIEATVTDDGLAIKGRFDLDTDFGKSAYRNTKGRRVSGLSIGYAIRNSTKTAAGHELTDLELIEVPIDPSPHLTRAGVQHPFARAGCYCAVRMTNASVFPS
jgi:HK97 family phage prohead protease